MGIDQTTVSNGQTQTTATAPNGVTSTTTVGLLFSDIEGSTKLLQQLGPAYSSVLLEQRELMRAAFLAHGGIEQGTEGDSFFVTFAAVSDAVAAALDGQRSLAAHTFTDGANVNVRIGIHVGEIQHVAGATVGLAVHEAARIGAVAHGGQILASAATVGLAGTPPDTASWTDLGQHRLKDIGAPVQLFQLTHSELRKDFPPPRSRGSSRNNLPAQASAFIGREHEIAEIAKLLTTSRLITVTGSGGAGKSRIALRVAADQTANFEDGVWFVDLAPVSDTQAVAQQTAGALGFADNAAGDLCGAIGPRKLLLIFDNCEHLVASVCEVVDELLVHCQGVSVLATSREPLGVHAEVAWRLPSLDNPDALELFTTRARAVNSRFTITDANRKAVDDVCRRLDSIPLALELAAARLGSLSVEQLASRLDQRFRLLAGGARGAMARQRTLQATVDWSYDLLDAPSQAVLQRLGVFVDGFTLEAAEVVCATDQIDDLDVFNIIDQLVAKSLVVAEESEGAVRYRLLETIRHYALDRLLQSGASIDARNAHLSWVTTLAAGAEAALWFGEGVDDRDWLALLDTEDENLRAAFDWALDSQDVPAAACLIVGAATWLIARGRAGEGERMCERAAALGGTHEDRSIVAALYLIFKSNTTGVDRGIESSLSSELAALPRSSRPWLAPINDGYSAANQFDAADAASAEAGISECVAIVESVRRSHPAVCLIPTLQALAFAYTRIDNYDAARVAAEEALALAVTAKTTVLESRLNSVLAMIARARGDLDALWKHAERMVEVARRTGDTQMIIYGTQLLARSASDRGDMVRARDMLMSCLTEVEEVGTNLQLASALNGVAWSAVLDGDFATADGYATRAMHLLAESPRDEALTAHTAGEAARGVGDLKRAWDLFLRASAVRRSGFELHPDLYAYALEGFAGVLVDSGDAENAAVFLGCAATHLKLKKLRLKVEIQQVAKTADAARAALGDAAFDEATKRGAALTLEEALTTAETMQHPK